MINWHELFALSVSPLELVFRGSLMYLFLYTVFRTVLQRDVGSVGIADVLLLVLVADAAQNAMAGEYRSISDGLILVSTILAWNFLFNYLTYRFPRLRRLLEPQELRLIRDGELLRRNLRREFITEDELRAKLREHGITEFSQVRAAYMESDGTITILRRDAGDSDAGSDQPGPPR